MGQQQIQAVEADALSQQRLDEVIQQYAASVRAKHSVTRQETIHLYLRDVQGFGRWCIHQYGASFKMSDLNVGVMNRYRQWCRTRVSAGTFNRRRSALIAFCEWIKGQGGVGDNPAHAMAGAKWRNGDANDSKARHRRTNRSR